MQFNISQRSKTFKAPVRISEIDENGKQRFFPPFKMEFTRMTRKEFDAVIQSGKDEEDDGYGNPISLSEDEKVARIADVILKIAVDWEVGKDGSPIPFNKENVALLLDSYPEANNAIISAYVAAIFNGDLQRKN